jgi:hypothetical protein
MSKEEDHMSIFGSIMSKIFGSDAKAETSTGAAAGGASTGGTSAASGTSAAGGVDVEAIMADLAKKSGKPSNWRQSIVDTMNLLGLDSSLSARKELAKELGYTGDMNDSATMNIWLHKQVMTKLAQNGGKVPDDLKSHA